VEYIYIYIYKFIRDLTRTQIDRCNRKPPPTTPAPHVMTCQKFAVYVDVTLYSIFFIQEQGG
jgi:hypothetical protein